MQSIALLISFVLASCSPALATPTPGGTYFSVTYASILGEWQQVHPIGPGYIPMKFLDKDIRVGFDGDKYEYHCLESYDGKTENGKIVKVTHNCRMWQRDAIFQWTKNGTIIHGNGRCVEVELEPSTLVEAPELGPLHLVQFWDCDGGSNQQWAVMKDSHKIHNVARPDLCIFPLSVKNLVGAVDCKKAKDIGVYAKDQEKS